MRDGGRNSAKHLEANRQQPAKRRKEKVRQHALTLDLFCRTPRELQVDDRSQQQAGGAGKNLLLRPLPQSAYAQFRQWNTEFNREKRRISVAISGGNREDTSHSAGSQRMRLIAPRIGTGKYQDPIRENFAEYTEFRS